LLHPLSCTYNKVVLSVLAHVQQILPFLNQEPNVILDLTVLHVQVQVLLFLFLLSEATSEPVITMFYWIKPGIHN
jgi:hypothetical protein